MEKLHTTSFVLTLRKLIVMSLFVMYMISLPSTEALKIGSRSAHVEGISSNTYQNLNSDTSTNTEAKNQASSIVERGNENEQPNPEENIENPSEQTFYTVTVYPWNNHLGRPAVMNWTETERKENSCKDVPTRWQGKVRSIDTHNNCVILYNRSNCQGIFRTVKKGSPSHNRLSDICFQRKPMSARPCSQDEKNS